MTLFTDPEFNRKVRAVLGRDPNTDDLGFTERDLERLAAAGVNDPRVTRGPWDPDPVIPQLPEVLAGLEVVDHELEQIRDRLRGLHLQKFAHAAQEVRDKLAPMIEPIRRKVEKDKTR